MPSLRKTSLLALFGLFAGTALAAPAIDKLSVTPPDGAKVGDKVTATVEFSGAGEGLCGMELEFGDGRRETIKIKPETKLPIVVEHVYKTPGEHKVRAAGAKIENAFSCTGKQIVAYKVAPAPAPAAAKPGAAPAAGAAAQCPPDWALKGKVAKNGSYTCVPKKGVKEPRKPEQALACPAGTSYFTKGKTLGCEAG